jgi:hypothetical protein
MHAQIGLILVEILAVVVLGAYLFGLETRVRFLRRQQKRIRLAGTLPLMPQDCYRV